MSPSRDLDLGARWRTTGVKNEPIDMRIQYFLTVAGLSVVLGASVAAQEPVKKVADATHHVLKKSGNAVKQGAKDVGSATHHTLKKAGNATKTDLGNATGIHTVGGDVGKAAQGVSHTSKRISRKAKHSLKTHKADAHADLTKAGKDAKADVKKPN
jgi:hypothetical protein